MKIIRCAFMLLSELQLGGIMDDALQTHDVLTGHIRRFCFASTMLYVRCVCVGEKMNGKCNFQEGFYSICPTLSINVRQLHDRFHDSSMTTAAFSDAVAAVRQKNSPLLYCLDVLRDQQKKLIHTISIPQLH